MKKKYYLFMLFGCMAINMAAEAQTTAIDSTGLPGDNFSLQGALEMFKKASSPQEFERLINIEDNSVNNLDLDADGEIDYIRVIDHAERGAHAFVLQVAVSQTENQDIAVIEIEKTGDSEAVLQIIGDEDLYGEMVIVEPAGEENSFLNSEANPVARGPYAPDLLFQQELMVVNIWFWPSVRFIYGPVYRPWASPWKWRHYPNWWRPWRPLTWHVFHPRVHRYHRPFVVVHTHRVVNAHRVYKPLRVSSVTVKKRHAVAVSNYRVSRTKTTVSGHRGNSVTRTTTTVRGKDRKVKARTARARRVR